MSANRKNTGLREIPRGCKIRQAYESLGWKLVVADRMLTAIPQEDGAAEYVYFITVDVTGDITFKI